MIRGGFLSAKERAALKAVIGHPSETHGVARRANAVLLLDKGWSCAEVSEAPTSTTTRCGAGTNYRAGGLDELRLFDWHGRPGHLKLPLSGVQRTELDRGLDFC